MLSDEKIPSVKGNKKTIYNINFKKKHLKKN